MPVTRAACPLDGTRLVTVTGTNAQGDPIWRYECPTGDWSGNWIAGLDSYAPHIPEVSRIFVRTLASGAEIPGDEGGLVPQTGSPVTVNASGTTVVYDPAPGKKIRLHWIGLSTPETNGSPIEVDIILGGAVIYRWSMGAPGAFAHGTYREGPVDGTLAVSCDVAQPLFVNLDVEEV